MHRPSFLAAAVTLCTAALFAPPSHAQPMGPPPPPPDGGDPYGPPPDYAQPPPGPYAQPPAPPPFERRGWFAGFGLAAGGIGDEDSDTWGGGQFNAYFGGLLTPRVALVVDLAFGGYRPDNYDYYGNDLQLNLATITLGGQFFLGDRLWLRAGLGSTRMTLVDGYGDSYGDAEGRTFTVTGGYELMQRTSFALDLNVSLSATEYPELSYGDANTTAMHFGIGFSWY